MSSYRTSLGGDKSTKRKTWETHEGMWVSHVFYMDIRAGDAGVGSWIQASTAVRAAPIVCPEESPLVRPQAHTLATWIRRLPEGGVGGNRGKRVPSGHNRRRRLATRSSGKQQAERTAVRAAPIVCPEESRLLAAI